jgi:hypothetical protein
MHGPTCIFWANLTPFSPKAWAAPDNETVCQLPVLLADPGCRHRPLSTVATSLWNAASVLTLGLVPAVRPLPAARCPLSAPHRSRADRACCGCC